MRKLWCEYCERRIKGTLVVKNDHIYCSDVCVELDERERARHEKAMNGKVLFFDQGLAEYRRQTRASGSSPRRR